MFIIGHKILFFIKDRNLTVLKTPMPMRFIFSNHQFFENRNLSFKFGKLIHQLCDFVIRNPVLEFEIEGMNEIALIIRIAKFRIGLTNREKIHSISDLQPRKDFSYQFLMLGMFLIGHQILFLIKDGNLPILKSMCSFCDIFSYKELFEDGYSFIGGNKNGKIRLVEFIDYKCSYCKQNHEIIWNMLKGNSDVKFIVKEFPILGPQSVLAAKALLAILLNDTHDTYRNFSDILIKYTGPVNETVLRTFAKRAGSSIENLVSAMDSEQVNVILAKNAALANSLSIQGTPSFVIEDQIIRGFISENEFQKLIDLVRENL